MMRLLVICNPENRRVDFLREAATNTGWTIKPVAYERLLAGEVDLVEESQGCIAARIDSPGENFSVERLLLAAGAERASKCGCQLLGSESALLLEYELGRVHFPWQYFLGFKSLLEHIDLQLENIRWMNSPRAVATMFDKTASTACFQAQGVPTPRQLGRIESFDQLREILLHKSLRRVFVKLTTGSSASGAVALMCQRDCFRATTTVETEATANGELKLYNSLKLRHICETKEIAQLIDALVPHNIFAEEWLPKAAYDHRSTFDVRVVVVDGVATHFVPRVSSSPMTNLHLGNRRGDWELIAKRLGPGVDCFLDTCTNASSSIPGSFYAGLDVVIDPTMRKFHVLEANACGDLLPGIVDCYGEDSYTRQLKALRQQVESDGPA